MLMVCGSFADLSGSGYSVVIPVLGSSLPIRPRLLPVNQMLPSLSSASPCGPVWADFRLYSRIVWARPLRRHVPQIDAGLDRAFDEHRRRTFTLGEILHQVVGHRRPVLGWDRRVHVLHHAHDREPAFGRVADADAVDVVAGAAGVGEALLHRAFRPFLGGVLGLRGADLCQREREQSAESERRGELVTRFDCHGAFSRSGRLVVPTLRSWR